MKLFIIGLFSIVSTIATATNVSQQTSTALDRVLEELSTVDGDSCTLVITNRVNIPKINVNCDDGDEKVITTEDYKSSPEHVHVITAKVIEQMMINNYRPTRIETYNYGSGLGKEFKYGAELSFKKK